MSGDRGQRGISRWRGANVPVPEAHLAGIRVVDCLTLRAAAWWVDREVRAEERALAATFGADYEAYRAAVPRYLPLPSFR